MKEKIINLIIKLKWFIVILVPICSIGIFVLNLQKAGVETDWKIWFDEDADIVKNYDHFKDTFGTDDMAMITIHNENGIFNAPTIKNIQKITNELWQTKSVSRVDSITNYQYVYVNENDKDEIIVENLFKKDENLSQSLLKQKEQIVLNEPDLINRIISKDAKTTTIFAKMVYSKKLDTKKYAKLKVDIDNIIKNNKLENVLYINAGVPAYTVAFTDAIAKNLPFFGPLLFASVLLILLLIFRNFWCMILPIFIIIFSLFATLGIMFALGYKLNTFSSMFPIFIIAIGIADSVHIMWIWIHQRRIGVQNYEAIKFSLSKNLLPALITSVTTFFGFISLMTSSIMPIQSFGLITAIGVVVAFLTTISFIPAFLLVLNPKVKKLVWQNEKRSLFIQKYTKFIIKNDKFILIISLVFLFICMSGIFFIKIDTDFIRQFSKSSKIRQDVDFMESNLGGTVPIEVIVDSKKINGINNPEFLKKADEFEQEFIAKFDKATNYYSIINIIKKYQQLMHEGKKSEYKIPKNDRLISEYLLLYSLSLPQGMGINDMFDADKRYLRLTNMIKSASEQEKMAMYEWVKNWWDKANFSASLEGATIISAFTRIELTYTLINSILLALFLVMMILIFTFRKKVYMLSSILPNIMPLLIAVGVSGLLSKDLDLGVAIVAAMVIGIAVDDTVHFLSKYQQARMADKSVEQSINWALNLGGNAIIITTLILVVSFGLFLMSDFAMYQNFGFLSAVAFLSAIFLDLAFLPALLNFLEKKVKR